MKSSSWDFRVLSLSIALCLVLQVDPAHAQSKVFNANTSAQIINGILFANSSGQSTVIKVAPGTYRFGASFDSEFGPSVLPPIKAHVFLFGEPGSDPATTVLTLSGLSARIITVVPGGRLVVRNMTLSGSAAQVVFGEPSDINGGGAAGNFGGFLRFEDCVVSQSSAIPEDGTIGGGILSRNGRLELLRTTVRDNTVFTDGGGIALRGGSGEIRDSIIKGNRTDFFGLLNGAGILVIGGTLGIYGSTIADNVALSGSDDAVGQGAGIFNGGTVTIANSAIVGNVVGAEEQSAGSGGGIYNGGVMVIKNTTIGANFGGTSGGGIFNKGSLILRGVTVVGNEARGNRIDELQQHAPYPPGCDDTAPQLCITGGGGVWNEPSARITTSRTVFAGNITSGELGPDCAGTFLSQGHNAAGDGTDCKLKRVVSGDTSDLVGVDPRLGALVNNGKAGTAHYPLLADSPLIDAGGPMGTFCTFLDQIGQRRVDGNKDGIFACDVGAVEFAPSQ